MSVVRCINLDWLEVFCSETGDPHDAFFFRQAGFIVHEREYGTRVYHEMFTLDGTDGHPFIEVRRNPKNPLMPSYACHLRFVNRMCYFENAASIMQQFLDQYGYIFQRISRIDICLDFARFDDNTLPRVFMQRYMRGKFSKINQANIHSHGTDAWTGRVWNSVSWGSPSSAISTKFYNKTLELYDPKTDSYSKPYILQSWCLSGLIDDQLLCSLQGVKQEIWRVEFSIRSAVKNWVAIELDGQTKKYQSLRNTLDVYDSRAKLIVMFASLAQHYFHFKKYIMEQRKDRCPDRQLFRWDKMERVYTVEHNSVSSDTTPQDNLQTLIARLRTFAESDASYQLRKQASDLGNALQAYSLRLSLSRPYSHEEAVAWQQTLARLLHDPNSSSVEVILSDIMNTLKINKRTLFI